MLQGSGSGGHGRAAPLWSKAAEGQNGFAGSHIPLDQTVHAPGAGQILADLLPRPVCYRALALVVTDEQHRFGVRQREHLAEKGDSPHVLVMSATPIPRTLAIILYGDLSISVVDEMHQGPARSSRISFHALAWAPVRGKGSCSKKRSAGAPSAARYLLLPRILPRPGKGLCSTSFSSFCFGCAGTGRRTDSCPTGTGRRTEPPQTVFWNSSRGHGSCQKYRPEGQTVFFHIVPYRLKMLCRQHFRGRHKGSLVSGSSGWNSPKSIPWKNTAAWPDIWCPCIPSPRDSQTVPGKRHNPWDRYPPDLPRSGYPVFQKASASSPYDERGF